MDDHFDSIRRALCFLRRAFLSPFCWMRCLLLIPNSKDTHIVG